MIPIDFLAAADVATATDPTSAIVTTVAASGLFSAIVAGGVSLLTARSNRRYMDRNSVRDDKKLELDAKDLDIQHANDRAAGSLALAAETRATSASLLDSLRGQSESQSRTIEGLNKTITTLNETIEVLTRSSATHSEALAAQRVLVVELEQDRADRTAEHLLAVTRIQEVESMLMQKDAELLEWTQSRDVDVA